MPNSNLKTIAQLDRDYVWHPFTQMQDWVKQEPIILVRGRGATLNDIRGKTYLDANSSIWTNLHGHNHPRLNGALKRQLGQIAHTSALGFANVPASQLAARLIRLASCGPCSEKQNPFGKLTKAFFSDDGSTAIEVALKLAYEFVRRTKGPKTRIRFLALQGSYHGDTVGASSLGHIDLFRSTYSGLLFKSDAVMAPYCYRCPFNKAHPERTDARNYRQCRWECLDKLESKLEQAKRKSLPYSAFVFEPRIQGAAGMIAQPENWLKRAIELTRSYGTLLIADEVMTGFGRTGSTNTSLFACGQEKVAVDFLCLAKGLTGGYLPMAATLATQPIFDVFLGRYDEFKTFFHGHSYCGNPLAAATALENLEILSSKASRDHRKVLEKEFSRALKPLWRHSQVGDIRQAGLIAGIELVRNWETREPFDLAERAGIRVCQAMARRGVLTRPIGNVVVLMPPYCTTRNQLRKMVEALSDSIEETFATS